MWFFVVYILISRKIYFIKSYSFCINICKAGVVTISTRKFNFADICISFGTVFLVLSLVFFDTDALFPLGKKYRALAKESDEKAEEKKKQKLAKKQAKKDGNNG